MVWTATTSTSMQASRLDTGVSRDHRYRGGGATPGREPNCHSHRVFVAGVTSLLSLSSLSGGVAFQTLFREGLDLVSANRSPAQVRRRRDTRGDNVVDLWPARRISGTNVPPEMSS